LFFKMSLSVAISNYKIASGHVASCCPALFSKARPIRQR
jgi:hypothetical protein